jgi:tether containing UBX domain for GLUT4
LVLKNTTFADLGLGSGNGSIRLLEQFTTSPIEEFIKEIESNPPKRDPVVDNVIPVESNSKLPINPPSREKVAQPQLAAPKMQPVAAPTPTPTAADSCEERPEIEVDLKVYKPAPDGASPANSIFHGLQLVQLPASFYSLNSSELKVLIDGQRANLNALENRPLMTKSLREREQKLREQKYPKTMIRVRFPDRYIMEATFYSGDKGKFIIYKVESLFKLVAENLAFPGSFRLYVTPPQTDLDPSMTFWKSKLAPASLIHFAHGDSSPGLSLKLLEGAIDYPITESPVFVSGANDAHEVEQADQVDADQVEAERSRQQSISAVSNVTEEKKGKPKWFRL